jgi:hypothetical protein
VQSFFSFSFEPFSGRLQMTPTLNALYAVLGLLLVSDYLWRVSQSFRIVATHWSSAANLGLYFVFCCCLDGFFLLTGLPQVDCRNHKTEQPQRVSMSAVQMATSPLIVLPVIGIIISMLFFVYVVIVCHTRRFVFASCCSVRVCFCLPSISPNVH